MAEDWLLSGDLWDWSNKATRHQPSAGSVLGRGFTQKSSPSWCGGHALSPSGRCCSQISLHLRVTAAIFSASCPSGFSGTSPLRPLKLAGSCLKNGEMSRKNDVWRRCNSRIASNTGLFGEKWFPTLILFDVSSTRLALVFCHATAHALKSVEDLVYIFHL